jgi:transcriptional regulator with XRE-family HTH domain
MIRNSQRYGKLIRRAREGKGWSQTNLAKHLGYGQAWVAHLETGRLKNISEDIHRKLTRILGLFEDRGGLDRNHVISDSHGLIARNGHAVIRLIRLEDATLDTLESLVEQAPNYASRQYREVTLDTIGAIHQIPEIFAKNFSRKIDLKNIEAYFGRSSASQSGLANNIYQRFRQGSSDRKHEWGMVLAVTSIAATLHYEKFGISVVETLRKKKGLCIANETGFSKGNVGSTEPGFLYLTFKIIDQYEDFAHVLSKEQIDDAVRRMLDDPAVNRLASQDEIVRAAVPAFQQANTLRRFGKHEVQVWDPRSNKGSQGVKAFWR